MGIIESRFFEIVALTLIHCREKLYPKANPE